MSDALASKLRVLYAREDDLHGFVPGLCDNGTCKRVYDAEEIDAAIERLQAENRTLRNAGVNQEERIDRLQKRVAELERSLRNCLLLAARHRRNSHNGMTDDDDPWSHILRFCHEGGVAPSTLRTADEPSPVTESDEAGAFARWFDKQRQESFVLSHGNNETFRDTWGQGYRRPMREGWMARAALAQPPSATLTYSKACDLLARYAVALQDRHCCGDEMQPAYMAALKACTDAMGVQPDAKAEASPSATLTHCPSLDDWSPAIRDCLLICRDLIDGKDVDSKFLRISIQTILDEWPAVTKSGSTS